MSKNLGKFTLIQNDDGTYTLQPEVVVVPDPNKLPNANAGDDFIIKLPTSKILITGRATDPDGTISVVSWRQVNGPNQATFSTTDQLATEISNLVEGTYIFGFHVTDNQGGEADDLITVQVIKDVVVIDPPKDPGTPIILRATQAKISGGTGPVHLNETDKEGNNIASWIGQDQQFEWDVKLAGGFYDVYFHVASGGSDPAEVEFWKRDRTLIVPRIFVPSVGGSWDQWQKFGPVSIQRPAGDQKFRMVIKKPGFNFSYLEFVPKGGEIPEADKEPVPPPLPVELPPLKEPEDPIAVADVPNSMGLARKQAVGKMSAGSKTLILDKAAGYGPEDNIIVELKRDEHVRGKVGPGGSWPRKIYKTLAEMLADKNYNVDTYAGCLETGGTYKLMHEEFDPEKPLAWQLFNLYTWYFEKIIPFALQAKVLSVSPDGKTLELDTPAAIDFEGCIVWFDNQQVIQKIVANNNEITLPAGTWPIGEHIYINDKTGFKWNETPGAQLFSPRGVQCNGIQLLFCKDMQEFYPPSIRGNARMQGFGFTRSTMPDEGYIGQQFVGLAGILLKDCQNVTVTGSEVIDHFSYYNQAWGGNNCWFNDSVFKKTTHEMSYLGWMMHFTGGANNGGARNFSIECYSLARAIEAFNCINVLFTDGNIINGVGAFNSATASRLIDTNMIFKAGSFPKQVQFNSADIPVLDVNAQVAAMVGEENIIDGLDIVFEGFMDTKLTHIHGVLGRARVNSMLIENSTYTHPDLPENVEHRIAFYTESDHCRVDNCKVYGKHSPSVDPAYATDITVKGPFSVVSNSKADYIRVEGTGSVSLNNTTMYL